MKILIVANHYPVCSARYAADAFARLGHEVRHVGPAMGRSIWGLELPERYAWEPHDIPFEDPDLVIVMDSDPALLDGTNLAKLNTCPVVVWGVDNHVRDYRRPWFNHYFLAHRNVSVTDWYWLGGAFSEHDMRPDMTHLPCAYDPTVFTPSTIPWAEREYDVAMIGVMYPQRWEAVQQLRAAGLKVIAGTGLVYENMAAAYQNSRISLCLSATGDVGQRIFESAACGCVVVSDECEDFGLLDAKFLNQVSYDETVVEAAQHILGQPAAAGAQLAQQLAWVKSHTWDARAQVIADWLVNRQGVQS